jgi:tetratricopeptide (TPR) repeat protein
VVRRVALVVLLCASPASAQESGLEALRAAVKEKPADPQASFALGRALRRAGREAEALVELRRGAVLAPRSVPIQWEIARVHMQKRDYFVALGQCRLVQGISAADGRACAAEAHLVDRAAEALSETPHAPNHYDAKVAEGRALEMAMKETEAEAAYKKAIELRPDRWEAYLFLGKMLLRTRKDEATLSLKRAAQLDPTGPEAAYELGAALPPAEAAPHLERATRERPSYGEAWVKLAEAELALNHLPQARKAAETAVRVHPKEGRSHVALARVAFAEGKDEEASRAAQAALAILTTYAPARVMLGDLSAKKGDVDAAVEQYQLAWAADRTDPAPLVKASKACAAAGLESSAKAWGLKATQEFPTHGPAWVALGDAYVLRHEAASARQAFERALKEGGAIDRAAVERKIASLK